jgi:hypothetical protein
MAMPTRLDVLLHRRKSAAGGPVDRSSPIIRHYSCKSPRLREILLHQLGMKAMTDKKRLESLTSIENDVQIEERAKHAMETYFSWLQNAMSAVPWSNTNLNRILLSNATQNITATLAFVQKLSQAKNFEEVVKLQTEFMGTQMNSFNEQSKVLSEIYTKAAEDAMKRSN